MASADVGLVLKGALWLWEKLGAARIANALRPRVYFVQDLQSGGFAHWSIGPQPGGTPLAWGFGVFLVTNHHDQPICIAHATVKLKGFSLRHVVVQRVRWAVLRDARVPDSGPRDLLLPDSINRVHIQFWASPAPPPNQDLRATVTVTDNLGHRRRVKKVRFRATGDPKSSTSTAIRDEPPST